MAKKRHQKDRWKDLMIAGGICLVVIGSVLYFVPRFLSGNKESGGSLLRIAPVAVQAYSAKRQTMETKRYSIRIGIANALKSEHVCRYAPRVVETVQQMMRQESRNKSVSLASVETAALEELKKAAGSSLIVSLKLVLGKKTSEGIKFPKPPPKTKTCIL